MTSTGKKIGVIVIAAVIAAAGIFYFTIGKSSRTPGGAVDPAFAAYISSYTAGIVTSGSSLRIILAEDGIDSTAVGKETSVRLFEFSPSVKGTTKWLDKRTVEFVPAARLSSGQIYGVQFFLSKVLKVSDALQTFEYSFQVVPQNYDLSVENIKPYVKTDLRRQRLEGTLLTADFAEPAAAEQVVQAHQDGKALKLSWTHSSEGKQHAFVVEDVARKDSSSIVKLTAKGTSLGINQDAEKTVEIPALGDFKVMNVRVDQSGSQSIVLQFSDPLNEKQNLAGLISIPELPNLDFEIKDNEIRVFPPIRQSGTRTMTVETGIRNILNYRMKNSETFSVVFEALKPEVRLTGKGSILPSTDGLVMPFEAVNLKAVDVEIVKIFENNILQFLQNNDIDGDYEVRRVGRPVLRKNISLEAAGVSDLAKWNRFTLDLSKLISTEPGAIYQVRISFKRSYAALSCDDAAGNNAPPQTLDDDWSQGDNEASYWDMYDDEYEYYEGGYDWDQRDNPCNNSYYTRQRDVKRNVLASDVGLLAKRGGDGKLLVVANDLKTTAPLSGVTLELYDYQQQLMGTVSTGPDGMATIESKTPPFAIIAKNGPQRGYLKLFDGLALSLSNFDVGGEQINKGLKGFIYGERGVWRPGDSLFLSFILEDKMKLLPANHPVALELQNPQGQITNRIVKSGSENGFYRFTTFTAADAPTGNWLARVKVGGAEFNQYVRIETVKPNRLKINLDFGVDKIKAGNQSVNGKLQVNWLQGPPGKFLKAQFEATLTRAETRFQKYPDYVFEDPAKKFTSETQSIFEGNTDENGRASFFANLDAGDGAPGVLNATFTGKVFEESGNFSSDRFMLPFYPYTSFTGLRLPKGDAARGMLLTDTTHVVEIVTVDADGNPVSHDNIKMEVYRLDWRWWWDGSGDQVTFMNGRYAQPLASGTTRTVNGKGSWKFRIGHDDWGRIFIRASDPVSGHSTGQITYIDWPGWAGRSREGNEGVTMLSFSSDKAAYNIGEKAVLNIPGSDQGRALISIENGSHVVETFWLETKKGDNSFTFDVTREMTPNIFAHVTMLQPHAQTANDLPIRLYGVIPIKVEDPQTHLNPVLSMPDVLEPNQEVVIKVSEQNKRKMTYTLAVVEEGLLDLTHFKTPDPWSRFYAREALGVKTWDLYDEVIGAFGGRIERLMAIGGDGSSLGKEDESKSNRFKPVVKYFGPFTSDGRVNEHRFTMPSYVGSVRTMVIAGYEGAYGKTEKATPVRKPLMVLATLPRVLGPEETLKLPVTLFSMDPTIKEIKVDAKVTGPLALPGKTSQTVTINGSDVTIDFDLAVKSATGKAKVEIRATSGKFNAIDEIEIDVRNPNPPITKVLNSIIEPGQTWTSSVQPVGIAGSNTAVLEVSTFPPINLGQRLSYLIQYPHGCIEQTTSSVFPQLYLDQIKSLTELEKASIASNVSAGIERIRMFVTRDGGFGYWPGAEDPDSWGTSYAGHFLIEAEAKGYFVPRDLLKKWKKFQKSRAQSWRSNTDYQSGEMIQAYRLYTLALSGEAELGAMNRLREQNAIPTGASWMLAAAYLKAGQPEAAHKLIANLPSSVNAYRELGYSYGSDLRDKAIILETLVMLDEKSKAVDLVRDISTSLSDYGLWLSTQTVAWSLKSIALFAAGSQKGELKFTYSYNGKDITASSQLPMGQVSLPVNSMQGNPLRVQNGSKGSLFLRVIEQGVPARGQEDDAEENLTVTVSYTDVDGKAVNPASLEQGQEFVATVTVGNLGYRGSLKNLSLTQIFPSGWEINNLRLDQNESRLGGDKPTYQDIRDDRVYSYFDLAINQRKSFKVLLTAAYAGTYYLPSVNVEAMYDKSIFARRKGQVVEVVKPRPQ